MIDQQEVFLQPEALAEFSEPDKRTVYTALELRRDIRHFRSGAAIDDR